MQPTQPTCGLHHKLWQLAVHGRSQASAASVLAASQVPFAACFEGNDSCCEQARDPLCRAPGCSTLAAGETFAAAAHRPQQVQGPWAHQPLPMQVVVQGQQRVPCHRHDHAEVTLDPGTCRAWCGFG